MVLENLSKQASETLQKIMRRHKVRFEPFQVGDAAIKLLQITDIEPLLAGKDPFKNVSEFPFWVKLWEASMALAGLIASNPPSRPGQTLLELGAGLGAPGLIAACKGYEVTLSDYEPIVLDFQRVSASASELGNVHHRILDWANPPDIPPFEVIIGAEILFREEWFAPLLALFKKYLAPSGVIYLAHDRRRKSLAPFLQMAEKDYQVGAMTKVLKGDDGETITVVLNRLTARQ